MKFSWWKLLGLAGVGGVAATGAIIARDQRQRAQLSPDDVRSRLHERLAEAQASEGGSSADAPAAGRHRGPR
ncbi:hypothetical protein [Nocardioides aurantiacus]|uniref:Uncharacterized protein n=1 Tax=Nocardioides aurantiacus TaxID=86796 RepID=A0A3N2CYL5_9ACTN|nr:hypothetical protein [Nocardioides aurantiacus]ROR92635.1 hypothetical protein EDD33_3532 [Nocardioides aurantiacus]